MAAVSGTGGSVILPCYTESVLWSVAIVSRDSLGPDGSLLYSECIATDARQSPDSVPTGGRSRSM